MEKSNIVFLRRIEEARARRKHLQKEEIKKQESNHELVDYFADAGET